MTMTTSEIMARGNEPRQCSRCGVWKTNNDFAIVRRVAEGRSKVCKECVNSECKRRYYSTRVPRKEVHK